MGRRIRGRGPLQLRPERRNGRVSTTPTICVFNVDFTSGAIGSGCWSVRFYLITWMAQRAPGEAVMRSSLVTKTAPVSDVWAVDVGLPAVAWKVRW